MGGSSTQKTKIQPPTPQEQALMDETLNTLMPAYLDSLGYYTTTQQSTWETSSDYKALSSQLQTAQQDLDEAKSTKVGSTNGQQVQLRIMYAQQKVDGIQKQLDKAQKNFKPSTTFNSVPVANAEVEGIVQKYGADSKEYKDAQAAALKQKGEVEHTQADLDQQLLTNVQDVFNGNLKLSTGDQSFLDSIVAPYKDAANNTINYLRQAADKMGESTSSAINAEQSGISSAIGGFMDQVKKTGMDVDTAIGVLENRVKQTGEDMNTALDSEIDITKQLNAMQISDFTTQQRADISSRAAALGRSPSDPSFQKDLQTIADKAITETNLQLGQYAAGQKMTIASETGQALQGAAQERIQNAQTTGQGLQQGNLMQVQNEQAAGGQRVESAQQMGQLGVNIAGQQGQDETNIAGIESNERQNLAMLPISALGSGIQASSYINSIKQQAASNAGAATNATTGMYNDLMQQNFANKTTTTQQNMGIGGIIGGIVGTGISAAATYGKYFA